MRNLQVKPERKNGMLRWLGRGLLLGTGLASVAWAQDSAKRLTENELSDFSRLCHNGCVEAIIEAQDVDRNHSTEV